MDKALNNVVQNKGKDNKRIKLSELFIKIKPCNKKENTFPTSQYVEYIFIEQP